jgi:hypothetical protein
VTGWTRREKTVTTIEYAVPADEPRGACWNQVQQALNAAVREHSPWKNPVPADDAIRVHARDDEIVISFEKGEEPPW